MFCLRSRFRTRQATSLVHRAGPSRDRELGRWHGTVTVMRPRTHRPHHAVCLRQRQPGAAAGTSITTVAVQTRRVKPHMPSAPRRHPAVPRLREGGNSARDLVVIVPSCGSPTHRPECGTLYRPSVDQGPPVGGSEPKPRRCIVVPCDSGTAASNSLSGADRPRVVQRRRACRSPASSRTIRCSCRTEALSAPLNARRVWPRLP